MNDAARVAADSQTVPIAVRGLHHIVMAMLLLPPCCFSFRWKRHPIPRAREWTGTVGSVAQSSHVTLRLGNTVSFRCPAALWGCALLSLLWAARAGKLDDVQRWGLAVLAYLLFCPHVIATEELHLVLILAPVGDWRAEARPVASLVAVALGSTVPFFPGLVGANAVRIALVFAAKIGLALLLIGRSLPCSRRRVVQQVPP